MKKHVLTLFSCIALVAFMGMSGSALAMTIDPSCDLDNPAAGDGIPGPYNNDAVIHDFKIDTPDSHVEHAVSSVVGSGLACGSEWTGLFTSSNYYDNIDVKYPPGVAVNDTSTMPVGSYVGVALFNVMSTVGKLVPHQEGTIRIAPIAECAAETPVGGPNPGTIISCNRSNAGFYTWTTYDADTDTYWLTFGPIHWAGKAGLTHIKQFIFCGRVGSTSGSVYPDDCGGLSQPFLQKNGDASGIACEGGKGKYKVNATNRAGETTATRSYCVHWADHGSPRKPHEHANPKDKVPLP